MEDALCICGRLRRASRALTRTYDEALAPVGLTITQFAVLRHLNRLDQPTLAELAENTAHEKSGLWRTLQPLIRIGVVQSCAVEGRRGVRLSLTASGQTLLAEALPFWNAAQSQVGDALGERREHLLTLLKEVEALV